MSKRPIRSVHEQQDIDRGVHSWRSSQLDNHESSDKFGFTSNDGIRPQDCWALSSSRSSPPPRLSGRPYDDDDSGGGSKFGFTSNDGIRPQDCWGLSISSSSPPDNCESLPKRRLQDSSGLSSSSPPPKGSYEAFLRGDFTPKGDYECLLKYGFIPKSDAPMNNYDFSLKYGQIDPLGLSYSRSTPDSRSPPDNSKSPFKRWMLRSASSVYGDGH
jgi:hypothetical protein